MLSSYVLALGRVLCTLFPLILTMEGTIMNSILQKTKAKEIN